jgi:membrane protease YdiL (CAAX protease family)
MGTLKVPSRSGPLRFLIQVVLLSWILWVVSIGFSRPGHAFLTRLFYAFGGAVPLILALAYVYKSSSRESPADFWKRVYSFRRIGTIWYGILFLTVPALTVTAAFADRIMGGKGLTLEQALSSMAGIWPVSLFIIRILFIGPVPEEIAWRGFAQDRLQTGRSILVSSLIVGLFWTLWHLPLFFIPGTYQHGLGIGTAGFWLFMGDKIPQSIIIAWIFNHTKRSTLSAILFHFMINLTGEVFNLSPRGEIILILLWYTAALCVILIRRGTGSGKRGTISAPGWF